MIALENMRGRFNRALSVDPAGFSDGQVCAMPYRDDPAYRRPDAAEHDHQGGQE
jgi:hypothetical protein